MKYVAVALLGFVIGMGCFAKMCLAQPWFETAWHAHLEETAK